LVQIAANTPGQDDDEHRVDGLHPGDRHRPSEDVAVQLVVGVHGQHGELLLVERPERRTGDEHRDERDHSLALDGRDVAAAEDDDEVGQSRAEDHENDRPVEVGGPEHAGDAEHDENDRAGGDAQGIPDALLVRQRVGHLVGGLGQLAPADRILDQPDGHPDGSCGEPDAEAVARLEPTGEQGSQECTQVDPQVEDRKPRVPARILFGVEGADEGRRVGLDSSAADSDQDQPHPDAESPGQDREGDVAGHDEEGRVEQGAFGADEAIGHPSARDRAEVDQAAVGADNADGGVLGDPEAALLGGEVQVEQEDALHPVEAEPLPQLDAEQVGQDARLTEERFLVLRLLPRPMCDVGHALNDVIGVSRTGVLKGALSACPGSDRRPGLLDQGEEIVVDLFGSGQGEPVGSYLPRRREPRS
jgi:hypothetical protein